MFSVWADQDISGAVEGIIAQRCRVYLLHHHNRIGEGVAHKDGKGAIAFCNDIEIALVRAEGHTKGANHRIGRTKPKVRRRIGNKAEQVGRILGNDFGRGERAIRCALEFDNAIAKIAGVVDIVAVAAVGNVADAAHSRFSEIVAAGQLAGGRVAAKGFQHIAAATPGQQLPTIRADGNAPQGRGRRVLIEIRRLQLLRLGRINPFARDIIAVERVDRIVGGNLQGVDKQTRPRWRTDDIDQEFAARWNGEILRHAGRVDLIEIHHAFLLH